MNECFKAVHYERKTGPGLYPVKRFGPENAKKVRAFHTSFPEYSVTPLAKLDNLAMREALSDSFRSGLDTAEGTVPIDEGLTFTVADGVLTAALDLLLEQETPEPEERMDTLNTSWEES